MDDRRAFNAECQRRRRSNLAIRERENEGNCHCQRQRRADLAIQYKENEHVIANIIVNLTDKDMLIL